MNMSKREAGQGAEEDGQPSTRKPTSGGPSADSAWRELFKLTAEEVHGKTRLLGLTKGIPRPGDGFPVVLEECLALVMPSQRGPRRLAVYRRFLMAWLDLDATQAEQCLAAQQPEEMPEQQYLHRAFLFRRWLEADLEARRSSGVKETELKPPTPEGKRAIRKAQTQWNDAVRDQAADEGMCSVSQVY